MTKSIEHTGKQFQSLSWKQICTSIWFVPLVFVFILVTLLSIRFIANADIGFHLKGGQWMLEHKAFHGLDVFTYTVNQHEYTAMYWLFQLILYAIYALIGYSGISTCNTILIIGLFVVVFLRMKASNVPPGIAAIVLVVSACAMETRFSIRPETSTWLFLVIELWLLDQYYHDRKNLLFLLPLIQLLWTNFHGLFILGWIIIGAYFVSMMMQQRSFNWSFGVWFIIAILVSFINPYFLKGFLYPFQLLGTLSPAGPFKNVIAEFASPWTIHATQSNPFIPAIPLYMYYTLAIVTCVLVIATFKRRSFHEFLLTVVFTYISSMAIRNIPLFIIIAIHICAVSLRDLWNAACRQWKLKQRLRRYSIFPAGAFALLVLLFCLRIISNAYYVSDRRQTRFGLGINPDAHPVGAAEFIVRNDLNGRVMNDLNTGSWLIWTIPQPVFIDGRLEVMGVNFFNKAMTSFSDSGLGKLVDEYHPVLIIFNHTQTHHWISQLRRMPDWRLIYLDGLSAVYARNDYAPDLAEKDISRIIEDMDIDAKTYHARAWDILNTKKPSGFTSWLEGFYKRQAYPGNLLNMGRFALLHGSMHDAEVFYLAFLQETQARYFEAFANLGVLYYRVGDHEKALYCYEQLPPAHVDAVLLNRQKTILPPY